MRQHLFGRPAAIAHRRLRFKRQQSRARRDQLGDFLLRREEEPFAHDIVVRVEQAIHGLESEVRHPDPVRVGEGERDAQATAMRLPEVANFLRQSFERENALLPHQVCAAELPQVISGVLSGPSFAAEVARGQPTALTLASADMAFASATARELHGGSLRVYSSADVIGVEVAGAAKNVMAIASGICDGLKLGLNARAALMTRGLAEIDWEDVTEYAPAVVTAISMPLAYSIATGIGLGFISYALVKIVSGKMREASPAVIVLALLFAAKFAVTG